MLGLLWVASCAHTANVPAGPEGSLSRAQRLLGEGKVQQAYQLLLPVADQRPADLVVARTLTEAAFRAGRLAVVQRRFQAMLIGELAGVGHYGLALAEVVSGPAGKVRALEHFALAARAQPDEADIPYRIGLVHLLAGEYEPAAEALQRALRIGPQRADIRVAYANCLDEQGRGFDAVDVLRQLQGVELSPKLARKVMVLSARVFDPLHRAPPDALPDLKKALELLEREAVQQAQKNISDILIRHPDLAIAHVLRGLAHSRLGNNAESIVAFERALQLSAHEPLAWMGMGDVYQRLEKWSNARNCYEKTLALNPFHLTAHMRLGEMAMQRGDYSRAVLAYQTLASLEPDRVGHRHRLGQSLTQAGRLDAAVGVYQDLLDSKTGDLEALIRLGQLHLNLASKRPAERQRLRERAQSLLQRARDLAPDNQAVLEMLAHLED